MLNYIWGITVGFIVGFILFFQFGATDQESVRLVGDSGDPIKFNHFEVYTFKESGIRCFIAVKSDGNIDLDCP